MIIRNRFIFLCLTVVALGCTSSLPMRDDRVMYKTLTMQVARARPMKELSQKTYHTIANILDGATPILDLYRQDITHDAVVHFFVELTGSEHVAFSILHYADIFGVPVLPIVSLAWVESRFDVFAVNVNSSSIDRGLFQLNSRTFSSLSERDFFDPQVNARHGIAYFRGCLAQANSVEQAVAIYNAGAHRVLNGNIPSTTERHVRRIVQYSKKLEETFRSFIFSQYPGSET